MVFGVPDAANGPNPDAVNSRRERPWLSRYRLNCAVRWRTVPSVSVSVVSDVAVAENGAPFTTFPCPPSNPINSMGPPKPGPPRCGPCARAVPAVKIRAPPATRLIHVFRFIPVSPLPLLRLLKSFYVDSQITPEPALLPAFHRCPPANPPGSTLRRVLHSREVQRPRGRRVACPRVRSWHHRSRCRLLPAAP